MSGRASRFWLMAVVFALGGAVAPAGAQPRAPIYLQYDGFVKNADGTRTLAFGYFNMNHVDVEIPPGPDNEFLPGPADRQQPVTFLEGRHRFACVMVVPADFDGNLAWHVTYAGATYQTTPKLLDPLYELELNSQRNVLAGLDLAKATTFTCANKAPVVALRTGFGRGGAGAAFGLGLSGAERPAPEPTLQGKAGVAVNLNGTANDDHMPRGSSMSIGWKKLSGPGEVTFRDPASARTSATFSAPGEYELELDATDGQLTGSTTVKVEVGPA